MGTAATRAAIRATTTSAATRAAAAVGPAAVGLAAALGRLAAALTVGLSRGAAAALGSPRFAQAHALAPAVLVALGPLLRDCAPPHSVLARPHNLLQARLVSSAGGWTALLAGGLLVAAWPLARPGGGRGGALLRAGGRLAVGAGLARAAPPLCAALEAAAGVPVSRPAFALAHCGLALAEEAAALGRLLHPPPGPRRPGGELGGAGGPGVRALSPLWLGSAPRRPGALLLLPPPPAAPAPAPPRGAPASGLPSAAWPGEGPRRPGAALCLLFLLNVALLLLWHGLLAATLAYGDAWAPAAAGAGLGWAAWALTYRLWYRCPCSPGRPGLGLQPR